MKKGKFSEFLKRKKIVFSFKRYFIDAMGNMALGLFASLLIGTIFGTIAEHTNLTWLSTVADYCKGATGAAMAVAIGAALEAPPLVLLSLCAVGIGANAVGGPLGTFIAVIIAAELGKLVSKETKIDILVTPCVTILSGLGITALVGPGVAYIMNALGEFIMTATKLQPFWMGIVISVVMGMVLTLPISSAAICASLGLVGLAGGAATAGCCAQMVGFAVMSFKENKWGGLVAQGLGTSMLQMGNIMRNGLIWIPPTLAAAITGPIATCLFKLESGIAVSSGMGTCGMVGPIGIMSSENFGSLQQWIGLVLVCIVLPAILTLLFALPMRKLGLIKENDLKLDL